MFYKVMKDNKVIDVLDSLVFLKYQEKHKRMIFCDEAEAQAIHSSDGEYIWHTEGLYYIPPEAGEYDEVELVQIDEYEYAKLKALNLKTPEEIIDAYTLSLMETGVI